MPPVIRLSADLTANNSGFEAAYRRTASFFSQTSRGFQSEIKNLGNKFESLTSNILGIKGALAGLGIGGGLGFMSKQALDAAEDVGKFAKQLGLTTTEFQRYQYAANVSEVSTEDFVSAIGTLNKKIAEGSLPFKSTNDAITQIADRMSNAKSGIERAGIAFETMGKSGRTLIPFLSQGSQGIKALGDEAERLGIVLDQQTIDSAGDFKDQLETLGMVISRNFQQGLLDGFVGDSQTIRDLYTDPAFREGVMGIGEAFGMMAKGVIQAADAFRQATIGLAAFGIEIAKRSQWLDPEVADEALKIGGERMRGENGDRRPTGSKSAGGAGGGSFKEELENAKERAKTLKEINDQLTRESVLIDTQVQNYGQKKSAIDSAVEAKKIELDLAQQGITLTDKERAQIQDKLNLLAENREKLEELKDQNKEMDEIVQRLGFTFKSAFEDAIIEGKSFRDVLKSIIDDIFRLFIRMQITEPATKALGGLFGGGGGGLLGGLFGGFNNSGQSGLPWQTFGSSNPLGGIYLGSFADGLPNVPQDGMAMIHRNEAVLTADEAAAWRAGDMGGGGPTYYIDAKGADRASITELKGMLLALAGPGRVEERVANARRRGQL